MVFAVNKLSKIVTIAPQKLQVSKSLGQNICELVTTVNPFLFDCTDLTRVSMVINHTANTTANSTPFTKSTEKAKQTYFHSPELDLFNSLFQMAGKR